MQRGYTKYPCFLCLWDSWADDHYAIRNWLSRHEFIPGSKSVKYQPLVDPDKVLLPSLHIKLGLVKSFVKRLQEDGDGFKYLQENFRDWVRSRCMQTSLWAHRFVNWWVISSLTWFSVAVHLWSPMTGLPSRMLSTTFLVTTVHWTMKKRHSILSKRAKN